MAASPLETGQAGKKVWLVKVPTFVAKQWRAAAAQSVAGGEAPELGRIRYSHDATQNTSQFELQLPGQAGEAPREFNMRVQTEDMQGMHSFAESRERGGISVTGIVEQRFDVEVKRGQGQVDAEYRAINRQRNAEASTKTRLMKIIDDPRSMLALRPGSQVAKRRADKPVDLKRARLEKDVLEGMLFRLFERQTIWNFNQLQKETDQPAMWLKEVLSNVAVLNKAGPNKDLWEVKKEFKHNRS